MKVLLASFLVLYCNLPCFSQSATKKDTTSKDHVKQEIAVDKGSDVIYAEPENNEDQVYMVVEEPPKYRAGMDALLAFIKANLNTGGNCIGKVFLQFTVTKHGELTDLKILKGLTPPCDAEAIRVVGLTGNGWIAGRQNSKAVNVRYVLPVKFED